MLRSAWSRWAAVVMVVAAGAAVGPVSAQAPQGKHPLDPVLAMADETLARVRRELDDYTCTIIRRERIRGKLSDFIYMDAAIRNRKTVDGKLVTPLSVQLKFLQPASVKGRQVVWVEGKNNGKMWVSEPVLLGAAIPVWLLPTGSIAMAECKYPIMDIGMENLLIKLLERGKKDRDRDRPTECEVKVIRGVKVENRSCTMISIRHPVKRPEYDYYLAQVFMDDEYRLPTRYAAYGFPATMPPKDDKEAPVEEEYTYLNLKQNVGLKDQDFDR